MDAVYQLILTGDKKGNKRGKPRDIFDEIKFHRIRGRLAGRNPADRFLQFLPTKDDTKRGELVEDKTTLRNYELPREADATLKRNERKLHGNGGGIKSVREQ